MRFLLIFIGLCPLIAKANVVGVDAQNFNPTTNGLDFVTVHSSKTLSPGVFNFGMFFNYAINTLPNYENVVQDRFEPRDSLTSMDINMGVGLMNNWDIGISVPQVLSQTVDPDSTLFRGQFEQTGINEIRINSKYRIWDGLSQGLAIIGSVNFFMIEDFPFTGSDPGPTYNLEAAYDNTIGQFTWAVNAGYRFRNPGDPIVGIPITPFPDQVIASVAASYYFSSWDFKVIAEVFGSMPTEQTDFSSDRELSTAEFLLGGKWDLPYDLAAHFGAGTEIIHGTASPDFRAYAGVNWSFGPLFSSKQAPPASDYYIEEETEETYEETSYTYIDDEKAFTQPPTKPQETFMARNVLFEFNGTTVNPDFYPFLEKLAGYLMAGDGFTEVTVIGHTDSVGSDAYNLKLSQARAAAVGAVVAGYLPADQRSKMKTAGEGERQPIASNNNYQGRALNRRVEFFIHRGPASAAPVEKSTSPGVTSAEPSSPGVSDKAVPTQAPVNAPQVSPPMTPPLPEIPPRSQDDLPPTPSFIKRSTVIGPSSGAKPPPAPKTEEKLNKELFF